MGAMKSRELGWLAAFMGAAFGAAALGGAVTARSIPTWYRGLRKPELAPPNWVFGPVWTALYVQMAFAAWLVHRGASRRPERADAARLALGAWWLQLALNLGWSLVFFGGRRLYGGLAVIAALWAAIAATAGLAARVTRLAAVLLLPYLTWVSFASYLNYRLAQLNRSGE